MADTGPAWNPPKEEVHVPKVATSVVINRPTDEVFDYMSDFDNLEWTVGLLEVRHEGPLRLGAEGTDIRVIGRKKVEMPWKVIGYDRPHRVVFRYQKPFPVTADFRLVSYGSGTQVTCETTISATGVWRLLGPFMVFESKKTDKAQFVKLKRILESRTA